jgi:hypothetical protein
MSEVGFAAERGADLLSAVGWVRIAMGEPLLEPVSNIAHISNRLVRTLAPSKDTASAAAEDRLCTSGGDCRHVAGVTWRAIRYSSPSSAERSSVRAFERITSAASSRESPPMSVSHTNASMPIVAPIP